MKSEEKIANAEKLAKLFSTLDKNNDGQISVIELQGI